MGTSQSSHCEPNTSSVPDTGVPDPTCVIWYWLGQLGTVGVAAGAFESPVEPETVAGPLPADVADVAADACTPPSPIPRQTTARTPPMNHQTVYLRRNAVMSLPYPFRFRRVLNNEYRI